MTHADMTGPDSTGADSTGADKTGADELERLRARVAELEGQLHDAAAGEAAGTPPARKPARRSGWWAAGSGVLLTLACLLAPLSVTSVWASSQISDTDRYVETVAPLADDPAVQAAIANKVSTLVLQSLDVEQLTADTLDTLAAQPNVPPRVATALPALAVPISNGIDSFTRTQVRNLVASPQFADLWVSVNRIAHEQVVKLLEGNQGGAVSAQDNQITLNLAPIIEQVKARLVAQGFTLAENIPVVDTSFVLVQSDSITNAQGFYRILNTLGAWLPLVVVALFVIGVLLARDRRRALLRGAIGVTVAMVLLGVLLAIGRTWYVQATPANVLTEQAAGNVFDTLVRFLRTGLRAAAVLGLILAFVAFLAGPSTAAVRTRTTLRSGMASLQSSADEAGWQTGPVGAWTYANKGRLRIACVIIAGLVLMFWTTPTTGVVLLIAVLLAAALAVVEFLARPPLPGAAAPTTSTPAASTTESAPAPATPAAATPAAATPAASTAVSGQGAGVAEEPLVPRQVARTPDPVGSSSEPDDAAQELRG